MLWVYTNKHLCSTLIAYLHCLLLDIFNLSIDLWLRVSLISYASCLSYLRASSPLHVVSITQKASSLCCFPTCALCSRKQQEFGRPGTCLCLSLWRRDSLRRESFGSWRLWTQDCLHTTVIACPTTHELWPHVPEWLYEVPQILKDCLRTLRCFTLLVISLLDM